MVKNIQEQMILRKNTRKKPRLTEYVENVDSDKVTRGPDEKEVIRPASPETARRVGEEAIE
jgi:hypothetical protein